MAAENIILFFFEVHCTNIRWAATSGKFAEVKSTCKSLKSLFKMPLKVKGKIYRGKKKAFYKEKKSYFLKRYAFPSEWLHLGKFQHGWIARNQCFFFRGKTRGNFVWVTLRFLFFSNLTVAWGRNFFVRVCLYVQWKKAPRRSVKSLF